MERRRSALRRLARLCHRRRRLVLLAWIAALVALSGAAGALGGTFEDEFSLPGSESQEAVEVLEDGGFPTRAGFQGQLVVAADDGIDRPDLEREVTALLDRVVAEVPDAAVTSPYSPEGAYQVSADGTVAFAEIALADRDDDAYDEAVDTITALVEGAEVPGAQLELGGDRFVEPAEGGSEAIGFLAAVVILLLAFGSLLAMGLPLVTALFGIGTGVAVVTLLANVVTMPSFTLQLVMMLAIGVGIDYALFIVTRYRQALADGHDPATAVEIAIDTAGRAVLFAGTTVVVSVLGLLVVGLDINRALGIAAAAGVATTMLASVTLLPALLGFVGAGIDRFGLPHRARAGNEASGLGHRWSRTVQRHPAAAALVGFVVLAVLAVPALSMRLGFGDAGNRPTTDTTRRAYDLLAEGFGPGANSPLLLVASMPDDATLEPVVDEVRRTEGVAGATPPIPNADGDVALVQVFPDSAPQDEATTELVHRLRDDVLPAATAGTGVEVRVGGAQAAVVDYSDFGASRLPVFIVVVLAVSFVILMAVFRSVLVPLKAVIMNLLSIGAAYGVVVAVFQWGWGASLIGIGRAGPVEAWAPMMLFAIVFGLSMDYEVFLLSRIREEYDRTGDNATAVATGLAHTARVITAAAAIMVVVFAGFVLSGERSLQLFGLGLATAVLVDATLVRLVLVPATMELLGDRNWWLPRWLDRTLPAVHIEGEAS
ncbi:MMPL family transporter [Iamia sp. SCSIO 61187]|uniref:MMPL family transporter n=1 Tax=Iamia sp. SCSIO 61187 TaxID=2722752 RepID=UPI001C636F50|nr:MMPL family transporter [Iamia sp. SCSIO 61187]QYG92494.1 MMPL family transporter [Iamia sp. SCSIO 61187]